MEFNTIPGFVLTPYDQVAVKSPPRLACHPSHTCLIGSLLHDHHNSRWSMVCCFVDKLSEDPTVCSVTSIPTTRMESRTAKAEEIPAQSRPELERIVHAALSRYDQEHKHRIQRKKKSQDDGGGLNVQQRLRSKQPRVRYQSDDDDDNDEEVSVKVDAKSKPKHRAKKKSRNAVKPPADHQPHVCCSHTKEQQQQQQQQQPYGAPFVLLPQACIAPMNSAVDPAALFATFTVQQQQLAMMQMASAHQQQLHQQQLQSAYAAGQYQRAAAARYC